MRENNDHANDNGDKNKSGAGASGGHAPRGITALMHTVTAAASKHSPVAVFAVIMSAAAIFYIFTRTDKVVLQAQRDLREMYRATDARMQQAYEECDERVEKCHAEHVGHLQKMLKISEEMMKRQREDSDRNAARMDILLGRYETTTTTKHR